MSKHISRQVIAEQANVQDTFAVVPEADRSFNLPTRLYVVTAGLYFSFLGVMAFGLASPGLIVPMGICIIFLTAFFGISALFVKIDPAAKAKIMRWSEFQSKGISTLTGRLPMKDAVVQMLLLPTLIVVWGLTVTTLVAVL